MMRFFRTALLFPLTALVIAATPAPALAHGGGGADASDFTSAVQRLVALDAEGDPRGSPRSIPEIHWRVLANDALLEVTNRSGQELEVPGYDGEPYLRIGPDGVWENRNSPAVYLNTDRYAQTPVPAGVSADADPDWVRVGDRTRVRVA